MQLSQKQLDFTILVTFSLPSPSLLLKFAIRDLQILRRVRLRVRDFLNTKQCTRVNQRHFGGKTRQPSSFYYEFQRECRGGENKLSNVRSFIILRWGKRVTSFTKGNSANFFSEKWYNEAFREVYILKIREKTLSQISYSQSSSYSNLKVSNIRLTTITNDIKSDSIGQYLAAYKIKLLQTCHSLYKSVAKQECHEIEILLFKLRPGIFHFQNLLLRQNEQYVARKLFDSSNERLFGGNQ